MNTSLKTRSKAAACMLIALFVLAPLPGISAQEKDEFGVWATFEASKKIDKKLKLDFEAELRSIEGVSNIDRVSAGAGASYKFTKWLKASAGYIFIYSHSLESKKINKVIDKEAGMYEYEIDAPYWTERHRFHVSLTGDYKAGRVEFSLRERVQYTHTNSATTQETEYGWSQDIDTEEYMPADPVVKTDSKKAKDNTTLRSRLSAKWDIRNCKVTPFASVELYTRLDKWKGCDKLRYRIGASYKINKDNEISLFYLYQDANDDDEPKGHAVGIGYSIDL